MPRRRPASGRDLPTARGPGGEPLHFRIKSEVIAGIPVTIAASAPRAAVLGPLRTAMWTLAASLAVLAAALVLAMLLQVRLGLRPLERLRHAIAEIGAGRAESLPQEQPRKIEPLASELNALLRQNAANLERARRNVANLAHGLKTPLATLGLALPKDDARAHGNGPMRPAFPAASSLNCATIARSKGNSTASPPSACLNMSERHIMDGSLIRSLVSSRMTELRLFIP